MSTLTQPEKYNLVDVRSTDEYTGKIIAPAGMTETAQRGGHIPGAQSIPWIQAVKEDGSFKSADDLKILYQSKGVVPNKETIAYCPHWGAFQPHVVCAENTCWATATSATTTGPGPSGEISWKPRSKRPPESIRPPKCANNGDANFQAGAHFRVLAFGAVFSLQRRSDA